ncbi:MAG: hypothetical protein ACYDH1_06895 [Anaerolineaceae bacterium]
MKSNQLRIVIHVKETLDATHGADWFEGLQISILPDNSMQLSGLVKDQAAVHGVLNIIRDLNLNLVSINVEEK